jgi:hypothetical protein
MQGYNSERIAQYIKSDLEGKRTYLLEQEKKARQEILFHVYHLEKLLNKDLIRDPDKVYPDISKHLYKISMAIRKVSISSSMPVKFIIDSMNIAQINFKKNPNRLLGDVIKDIESQFLPAMRHYYDRLQKFRVHIPVDLSLEIKKTQIFPSKQIRIFLDELEYLEKYEKNLSKMFHFFFKKYKKNIKDIYVAVEELDKGELKSADRFKGTHPHILIGTLCLCFTVMGYAGVTLTLGYGVFAALTGESIFSALFGVSAGTKGLQAFGNFFNSTGTAAMGIFVDKGVKLLYHES